MPRANKNAKRKYDTRMSFREMCDKVGLSPKQRIIMRRHIIYNKKFKGGEKL